MTEDNSPEYYKDQMLEENDKRLFGLIKPKIVEIIKTVFDDTKTKLQPKLSESDLNFTAEYYTDQIIEIIDNTIYDNNNNKTKKCVRGDKE